jgi:pyruvate kinase
VQKDVIEAARVAGKPVVTATDMLDSMRRQPRPTRAEVSDVANAVYDGTDAIMLSGETAIGAYPVAAVQYMDRIAREAETHLDEKHWHKLIVPQGDIRDHITQLTCDLARDIHAAAIITPTYSGRTPRMVARHRPNVAIIAPTPAEAVLRQLTLCWGVIPVRLNPRLAAGADRLDAAVLAALQAGAVQPGMRVIVLAGHPHEGGQGLPSLRVVRVGTEGQSEEP